ncbi:hypothetical protein DMENIID0001_088640 [Sergentomyia squamirostris]
MDSETNEFLMRLGLPNTVRVGGSLPAGCPPRGTQQLVSEVGSSATFIPQPSTGAEDPRTPPLPQRDAFTEFREAICRKIEEVESSLVAHYHAGMQRLFTENETWTQSLIQDVRTEISRSRIEARSPLPRAFDVNPLADIEDFVSARSTTESVDEDPGRPSGFFEGTRIDGQRPTWPHQETRPAGWPAAQPRRSVVWEDFVADMMHPHNRPQQRPETIDPFVARTRPSNIPYAFNPVFSQETAPLRQRVGLEPPLLENAPIGALQPVDLGRRTNDHPPSDGIQSNSPAINLAQNMGQYKMKLKDYDGTQPLEEYLIHFNMTATTYGWTLKQKGAVLANVLSGKAMAVLANLPEESRFDWDKVVQALKTRFGREHLQDLAHVEFKSRRQQAKEELASFAGEIRRLVRMAFPECPAVAHDRIATAQFVDGITDLDVQDWVRMARPRSLDAALIAAMECEASRRATRSNRASARVVEVRETEDAYGRGLTDYQSETHSTAVTGAGVNSSELTGNAEGQRNTEDRAAGQTPGWNQNNRGRFGNNRGWRRGRGGRWPARRGGGYSAPHQEGRAAAPENNPPENESQPPTDSAGRQHIAMEQKESLMEDEEEATELGEDDYAVELETQARPEDSTEATHEDESGDQRGIETPEDEDERSRKRMQEEKKDGKRKMKIRGMTLRTLESVIVPANSETIVGARCGKKQVVGLVEALRAGTHPALRVARAVVSARTREVPVRDKERLRSEVERGETKHKLRSVVVKVTPRGSVRHHEAESSGKPFSRAELARARRADWSEAHRSSGKQSPSSEKATRVSRAIRREAHHSTVQPNSVTEKAVRVRRAVVRAAHHSADNSTSREEAARVRRAVVRAAHHSTGRNSHPSEKATRVSRAIRREAHHSTVQPNSVTEKAVRVRRAVVRAAHHSADNSTSREEAARVRRAVVRAAHHSTDRNSHPRERAERVRRAVGGEAHHSKDPFTSEPPSTRSRAQKSRQRRREALTRFLQDQLRKNPRPPETSTDHTVPAGREISPPPSLATVARVNVSGEKCVTANQPEFTPPQRPKPQVQQHSPLSISGTPTSLPPTPGAKIKPPFCSERASTNSDSSWDGSVESLWLNSKIEGRSGSNEAKDLGRNTQTALEKEEKTRDTREDPPVSDHVLSAPTQSTFHSINGKKGPLKRRTRERRARRRWREKNEATETVIVRTVGGPAPGTVLTEPLPLDSDPWEVVLRYEALLSRSPEYRPLPFPVPPSIQ